MTSKDWVSTEKQDKNSDQMRKLKNVPPIRFSVFTDEWKTYKLEDLFTSKKGAGLSKEKLNNNGKNKCILYGELYTEYNLLISKVREYD